MDAALRGTITARTTSQVIMEFAHVRGRRRDRRDAASLARDFSDLLGPLEPTTAPDVSTALTLWQDNPEIGSFDALLLAVAVRIGAEAVVSEDAGLARVGIVPVMSAAEAVRAWA
jgi:predicted nucleic acid-binding protein